MAVAPLQLPGQISPLDITPTLSNLVGTINQGQTDQRRQQTLADLGNLPPEDQVRRLLSSGDMSLVALGTNLANTNYQHGRDANSDAWRQQEAQRAQQNADRSYNLQERASNRADEGPVETAAQRAQAARANGVDPTTPAGKAYILTGKLPEADTSFTNTIEQRKQAAIANGLDPSSPGYQSFVLTGKMPREDAQPLTATDKKAILEADELVQSTQGAISNLQKAKQLSKQAYSGPYADKRGYAASFLGESSDTGKAGIATTDLNNLVTTNALSQLKSIFGGNPTEGERAILLQIQGSANQPDEVRQKIYDRAMELASKRMEFNKQKADALRGNTYYKPGQGQQAGQSAPSAPTAANPAPAQGGVVDWQTYFGGGN